MTHRTLAGFTVTYRSRRSDAYTSTYRFMADYGRDVAQANRDAWAFMRAIDADGGQAGYPNPVWSN